jgi:hypothetical protein
MKFDIARVNGEVMLSDINAKLFYNYAKMNNGKVESMQFIDYTQLKINTALLSDDPAALREFEELVCFAETFLLKGNLEPFLIKEEGDGKSNK